MTLTFRRTLALLFAALFIIIALLSVAYGRGYRFDPKTHQLRLTGVILIAGSPNQVKITIDDEKPKQVSLPTTLRGLFPTTHTVSIYAPGYNNQIFTLNVRSGQTTFANDIQLYRTNPFSSIRTGIPNQAILAPDGSAVAWLETKTLAIADAANLRHTNIPAETDSLTWSENSEDIILQDGNHALLAVVSKAGILRDKTYVLPAGDKAKVNQLLNGRMIYNKLQIIPNGAGWLLQDDSSAWILNSNGDFTLATRWGNPIINAIHLGRTSLATVRREEVLVRNLTNAQTATYEVSGITQATAGTHEGEVNLLVADGDLLQWVRGNFF